MIHEQFAVSLENGIVPSSPLDNILKFRTKNVEISFYDFLNGKLLTNKNRKEFYAQVVLKARNRIYETTDHLITCININDINFLYVSLDNSVRANMNAHPLYSRIDNICNVLNEVLRSLNGKCIIFFSESCRPSFIGNINEKKNLTSWLTIRNIISKECNLNFLIEKRNNDDPSDMAFGISVFYTNETEEYISTYFTKNILNEGFGSVTVGVKLTSGEIVWGIHFPLDFKNTGTSNYGYKTMVNLQNVMKEYEGSVCAMGDFNTIPGYIADAINSAITYEFEFVSKNELTFFGAYYDIIPQRDFEVWKQL